MDEFPAKELNLRPGAAVNRPIARFARKKQSL